MGSTAGNNSIEIIMKSFTADLNDRPRSQRSMVSAGVNKPKDGYYSETEDLTDMSHSSASNTEDTVREEKAIFNKARQYLNPGVFFRYFTYLYAERKLLVFFWIHFMCTMTIWTHFALTKFEEQEGKVPLGAPRYCWKRMVPTLEFGAMHAILFQMALIPLTMSRYSIAALSDSIVDRFVPMGRSLRIHIHLGYIMVGLVFFATLLFFAFFGLLCNDGDQEFCNKFRSEIMITGYIILGFLLIIGGTSYFRYRIPYEVFYAIHHLVFLMYFVTIIHTFDRTQRSGERARSQTFKWFSSTLLYYFCDRAALHINHRYRSQLVASSVVEGSNGSKMVILRLRRPCLFHFKPGQSAYLRLDEIDRHWHPFAIASGPGSSCLEFIIEAQAKGSWTMKLFDLLQREQDGLRRIEFDVMGPYGTCIGKTQDYSHAVAIGSGTGIVPILSLFKLHVRQLLRLDPETFLRTLKERAKKIDEVECAEDLRKGSMAQKLSRNCCGAKSRKYESLDEDETSKRARFRESVRLNIDRHAELKRWEDVRENMMAMKNAAFVATRSIYGVVMLSALPVLGVLLLGLTISWNTVNFRLRYGMVETLQGLTMLFQFSFAIVSFCIWDSYRLSAFTDLVLSIVAPFADWYWWNAYASKGIMGPCEILLYFLLTGYMTLRLWSVVVKPRHHSWRKNVAEEDGFGGTLDRLELVWVTRSATQVSRIIPEISVLWDTLVAEWGKENACKVCRISIHVTDKDEAACDLLRHELADLDLCQSGAIQFGRPDFADVIENHTIKMISTRSKSYSLLAFCGSAHLANTINHEKISNDMISGITGNKHHQMEFVSETYGGYRLGEKTASTLQSPPQQLSNRRSVSYADF